MAAIDHCRVPRPRRYRTIAATGFAARMNARCKAPAANLPAEHNACGGHHRRQGLQASNCLLKTELGHVRRCKAKCRSLITVATWWSAEAHLRRQYHHTHHRYSATNRFLHARHHRKRQRQRDPAADLWLRPTRTYMLPVAGRPSPRRRLQSAGTPHRR